MRKKSAADILDLREACIVHRLWSETAAGLNRETYDGSRTMDEEASLS